MDTALAFLAFARSCVLKKTDGLTDEQLRRAMAPSGTSLLGLVQHLTDAERFWFGYQVAGHGEDDYDFSMQVPTSRSADEVLQPATTSSMRLLISTNRAKSRSRRNGTPFAGWSRT